MNEKDNDMRKIYMSRVILFLFCFVFLTTGKLAAQNDPQVVISDEAGVELSGPLSLNVGNEVEVYAIYTDANGDTIDARIKWSVDPGYLGKVDDGTLKAFHAGQGYLCAKYKGAIDSVEVVVAGETKGDDGEGDGSHYEGDNGDDHGDGEAEQDSIDYPKVKIIPGSVKVAYGDSVQFNAFYINDLGVKEAVSFDWSVIPDTFGVFSTANPGMFIPDTLGTAYIVAAYDTLADTVRVKVYEPKDKPEHETPEHPDNSGHPQNLTISPEDTIVNASAVSVQYSAEYKVNGSIEDGAAVEWSIAGDTVGVFSEDQNGMLLLNGTIGVAVIKAKIGHFWQSTELTVVDSTADTHINSITIHRVLPDGNELPPKHLMEGDSYKIGGLPYPLNVLNGGRIHFPFGSLHEDVTIYMFIPEEYAQMDSDSTSIAYNDSIIAGVKFNVKPNDSTDVVDPYYFDIPLNLSLCYKHGLLDSLDVTPEEIDLFFANSDSVNNVFVTDGLNNVVVDTVQNKIYAQIAHFSTIVAKPGKSATTSVQELAQNESSLMNYPNPFTSQTTIRFKVDQKSRVSIDIFSLNGQMIRHLVDREYNTGSYELQWNARSEQNTLVSPGVYIGRMLIDNKSQQTTRMVLSR